MFQTNASRARIVGNEQFADRTDIMSTLKTQQNGAANRELKDSLVTGLTSQGAEIRASLLRLTRFTAVFEIYNPGFILRASEVLSDFCLLYTSDAADE